MLGELRCILCAIVLLYLRQGLEFCHQYVFTVSQYMVKGIG